MLHALQKFETFAVIVKYYY